MAYISKRDSRDRTLKPEKKKEQPKWMVRLLEDDEYDDDLDGEDDDDMIKKSLDTEFPLSGGETDEGA